MNQWIADLARRDAVSDLLMLCTQYAAETGNTAADYRSVWLLERMTAPRSLLHLMESSFCLRDLYIIPPFQTG